MNGYLGPDGLPRHMPMLVTVDGNGPCNDDSPEAHHWECWCGEDCVWQQALEYNLSR